jgi:hypothetical protein
MIAPRYVKALVILMLAVPGVGVAALCGVRWVKRRAGKARANASSNQRRQPVSGARAAGRQAGSLRTGNWAILTIRALGAAMMLIQLTWLWYLRTEAMHDAGGID